MDLYNRLKKQGMVIDEKDFNDHIYRYQIKIDNIPVHPKIKLDKNKKYKATIGILTKEI